MRSALEGEPREIRYWHLLGLSIAAKEQWKAAKEILKERVEISDEYSSDDEAETATLNGLHVKDFGAANGQVNGFPHRNSGSSTAPTEFLLDEDAAEIAPAATLLRPVLDHTPPTQQEVFEHALQLRTTQVVLVECVEGPEGAGDRWVEVFRWIAEKSRIVAEQRESVRSPLRLFSTNTTT
jgi:hypothetical protein